MADNRVAGLQRLTSNLDVAPIFLRSLVGGLTERREFADVRTFCLFVGYPRSGHSMVGSLLNAHPDVVISHELDVLRYVDLRFRREQLYHLILEKDRAFAAAGRAVKRGFDYNVPEEWQGRYRNLLVIGDKRGNSSIRRLDKHPDVLDRLRRTVDVEVRIIHVARNPFDNITTMASRARCGLDKAIDRYFRLCDAISRIKGRTARGEVLDTSHEALIADPAGRLTELCAFLGVEASSSYLEHCASVVYSQPSRTRGQGAWTPERIERVERGIDEHDFLQGYSYAAS